MNTKGTKFLAVLAVLAMAFAAFAVVAPAETDDATGESVYDETAKTLTLGTDITSLTAGTYTPEDNKYYYVGVSGVTLNVTGTAAKTAVVFLEQGVQMTVSVASGFNLDTDHSWCIIVDSVKKNDSTLQLVNTLNEVLVNGTSLKSTITVTHATPANSYGDRTLWVSSNAAGDEAGLTATATGVTVTAPGYYSAATMSLTGNIAQMINVSSSATATWTMENVTGTVYAAGATSLANVDNAVSKIEVVKFTGELTLTSAGKVTVSKWSSGEVDVIKSAESATTAVIAADIPTGSTLYVEAGAFVETTSSSTTHPGIDFGGIINYGTISIKQTKTASAITGVGTFTLKVALKNVGVINNLGVFAQATFAVENTGKIVTGEDGTTVKWTATGTVENSGTFTFKETTAAAEVKFTNTSTGDVRNQTANNKTVTGTITNDVYGYNQSATITGNTTLSGTLYLQGLMVIDEGATLTILDAGKIVMANAQAVLINNGTISVQNVAAAIDLDGTANDVVAGSIVNTAGFIANAGTISLVDPSASPVADSPTMVLGTADATAAFVKNAGTFSNEQGFFVIYTTGAFLNSGVFEQSAILGVAGGDNGSVISNAGSINIDGIIVLENDTTISNTTKNATIVIQNLVMPTDNNALTIVNTVNDGARTIVLDDTQLTGTTTAAANYILSGLSIGAYNVPDDDGKADYSYFVLSGNASLMTANFGQAPADISYAVQFMGKAFIGNLTLQEKVTIAGVATNTLTPAEPNELTFYGNAVIIDPSSATIDNVKSSTVTGMLTTSRAPLSGIFDESTNSETAMIINAARYEVTNESYVKTYYYTTLANAVSMASEAGVREVIATGENTVETDLIIPAPMKVRNQGTLKITEDGNVAVSEGAELNNGSSIEVEGTLYAANARTGLTGATTDNSIISDVKVISNPSVLYTNLYAALSAAEAGDTVVITKNNNDPVVLTRNTTIPVGVTLDTNEKELKTRTSDTDTTKQFKLIVNGTLVLYAASNFSSYDDVTLNGYIVSDDQRTYSTTGLTGAYFATEVANIDYYYIAGINNLGEITASGVTAVDVYGDISAGDLAFAGTDDGAATVTFHDDVEITSITANLANIVFSHGTQVNTKVTDGASTATLAGAVPSTANTDKLTIAIGDDFTVSGKFGKGTEKTHSFALAGDVVIGALNAYDLKIAGTATTAKKAIVLTNALVVTGGITIDEKASLEAKYANVTGKLTSEGASKITNVTIGSSSKAIAAVASVTGEVAATAVIQYAGNTVDPTIVENMKYNNFYIDGKLWFTVYSNGNVVLAKTLVPVENAIVNYNWSKGNVSIIGAGDDIGKITGNVTPDNDATKYDISVKYDIYNVTIKTDAGVKAVYIDGQVMISPEAGKNGFTLLNLEAGTYKVTYTLINGYEGTAQLYTADGTILKDNSFVLSGTTETDVLLQLSGTEQIVTPEPSPVEQNEWTITTILLVILVILIAVMAVIVALRLNRS